MATLDDVLGGPEGSLDDVIGGESTRPSMSTAPSNVNLAAHVAAMGSPETVEQVYRTVNAELNEDIGGSATADEVLRISREQDFNASRSALIDLLADPTIPDEQKQAAARQTLDVHNEMYGLGPSLARASLEADTDADNGEVDFTRVSMGEALQSVNNWRRQAQMRVNQELSASNVDFTTALSDMLTYMAPFMEQATIGNVKSRLEGGDPTAYADAIALLGSSKQDIREMILSVPPENRMPITEAVISMVNASSSIALQDQNDYARFDMLRTFLEGGYYTDFDKWVDNVVGVLDLVGVGTAVRGFARTGRASRALEGEFIPRDGGSTTGRSIVPVSPSQGPTGGPSVTLTGETRTPLLERPRVTGETVNTVNSRVQPASVSQVYRDTNTGKARASHEAAMADTTGEAARALYGADRVDVAMHDFLPEIFIPSGRVKAKVNNPDYIYQLATAEMKDVIDYARNTGASAYFQKEKEAMRAVVVNNFEQVQGITPRKEMTQIESKPDGVHIRAMYGPSNSGFANPIEALEVLKVAFRKYGLDDQHLTLYARNGSEYEPVTLRELEGRAEIVRNVRGRPDITETIRNQQDFLVGVDYEYKFNPLDVVKWMETDVKYNLFDKIGVGVGSGHRGSLTRHLLDPASLFDPTIARSLSSAVDKSAEFEHRLLKIVKGFSDRFAKLPEDRQLLVEQHLLEANQKAIGFNYSKLVTDGFTPNEVEAIRSFRDYWDTIYWLRNRDFATTLRSQGYQEFVDDASGTRLVVKPIPLNQVPRNTRVLDQTTGTVVTYSRAEIEALYEKGGTVVRARDAIEYGEEAFDLFVAPNVAGKPYMRAITENSQVLNYRDGYFPVSYTDPIYIDRVYTGKDGTTQIRAVSTAGSTKDAKLLVERFNRVDGSDTVSFRYREDKKGLTKSERFDNEWDISMASGLSSQRYRGQALQTATSNTMALENAPMLSPVDTMVASLRSTSNRVSVRNVLDVYKSRTLSQYADYLPRDRYGKPYIPSDTTSVKYYGTGQEKTKDLGAARSHVEYVNYIENGYINDIDDVYKRLMKGISNIAGEAGNTKLEKAFQWMSETRGPTAMFKNLAFQLYLGTNPIRQLIVQSHQSTQLIANFPQWVASLRGPAEMVVLSSFELGQKPAKYFLDALGISMGQAEEMYDQWRKSGLAASVDKQNLLRGALLDLADRTSGKGLPLLTPALSFSRKVGFDAGETVNLMTSWLAHRDAAIRAGRDVNDLEVIEDFSAAARNYTYAMNAAGDMPYNANMMNLFLMYFQVPHKALLTATTNRQLTKQQKLNLWGYNLMMNPLPHALTFSLFGSIIPETDDRTVLGLSVRDVAISGLEGALLNKVLSMGTGEETYIAWSGLAPIDMYGMYDTLHAFATMTPGEVWANTPAGQLFAGQNPRFTNLFKSAARFTNFFMEDYSGPAGRTELRQVLKDFTSLSSGMSNAFKARLAYATGRRLNTVGEVIDPSVTEAEAVFMLAGMDTRDAVLRYWVDDATYNASQDFEQDLRTYHRDLKRHLSQQGITPEQGDYYIKAMSTAWLSFGNDNFRAKQRFAELLEADMRDTGEAALYNRLLNMHEIQSADEVKTLINNTADMPEETRKAIINAIDDIQNAKDL